MRIRTWIIWVLLAFGALDYGYHRWSDGWNEGYDEGYDDGLAQEPEAWKILAYPLKID